MTERLPEPATPRRPRKPTRLAGPASTAGSHGRGRGEAPILTPTRSGSPHGGRSDFRQKIIERVATHKHYPHHYVFLEQALMAREMERC